MTRYSLYKLLLLLLLLLYVVSLVKYVRKTHFGNRIIINIHDNNLLEISICILFGYYTTIYVIGVADMFLYVKLGFIFPLTVKTRHASLPGSAVDTTPVSKFCEFI